MNGTVLDVVDGSGIIIDENGQRYKFVQDEVKRGELKNGLKVNFVDDNGNACNIYLLESEAASSDISETLSKGFSSLNNSSKILNEKLNDYTSGSKINLMGLLAAAGVVLSMLFSSFSNILSLLGIAIELYALYTLATIKNDMSFFIYKIKAIVSGIIAVYLLNSIVQSLMYSMLGNNYTITIIKIIIFLCAIIYSIYSIFRSLTKMGKIFKVQFFLYSAWIYILALISPIVLAFTEDIGLILGAPYYLMLAYAILLILAYLNIKDDEKIDIK